MSAPGERLITDRAHTSLSQIHEQSVREALAQEGTQESWQIAPLEEQSTLEHSEFVMLSLCSFEMRMLATIGFNRSEALHDYLSMTHEKASSDLSKGQFYDSMGERCRCYGGLLDQYLIPTFPYMAMSIPNRLIAGSYQYFKHLGFELELTLQANSPSNIAFLYSIFVCPYEELRDITNTGAEESVTDDTSFI